MRAASAFLRQEMLLEFMFEIRPVRRFAATKGESHIMTCSVEACAMRWT